jgi:hypothetical protein
VNRFGLQALDVGFFIFHTVLVLFNLLGWIWPRTRRLNLYCLLITSVSWFVMGIWYGIGYCLCTDWHFSIRRQLGYVDDSPTYIHLVVKKLTGANLDPGFVQTATAVGFVFALVMSLYTNFRPQRRDDARQPSA